MPSSNLIRNSNNMVGEKFIFQLLFKPHTKLYNKILERWEQFWYIHVQTGRTWKHSRHKYPNPNVELS